MLRIARWSPMPVLISMLLAVSLPTPVAYAIPAFPGAEGFGANATGGRGGDVYHVTTLDGVNGTVGTLRHAISSATGPRTIVFDISGMITLTDTLWVDKANITIAGQTAPEQGICIRNRDVAVANNNVIVRHIRSRLGGDDNQPAVDSMGVTNDANVITNVILDHISASWSLDEGISVSDKASDVTIQYSYIYQGLNINGHSYGSLFRSDIDANVSVHHSLYADNKSRNPRPGYYYDKTLTLDFRNNVVYNWLDRAGYNEDDGSGRVKMNYAGSYFIAGTISSNPSKAFIVGSGGSTPETYETLIYQTGNKVDSNSNGILDGVAANWSNFKGVFGSMSTPFTVPAVYTQSADAALQTVLNNAGAFPWNRDSLDANVTAQVRSYGTEGRIINTIDEAGGWPNYPQGTYTLSYDTDRDGMPNTWEADHGLNPNAYDPSSDFDDDGYTNLEEYLFEIAPIPAPKAIVWTGGTTHRYERIDSWDIPWQPTLADPVEINTGKATVSYIDQEAGTLRVANTAGAIAELAGTAGKLTIANALHVGSASNARGTVSLSGGAMSVGGSIALGGGGGGAKGLLRLTGGSLTAVKEIILAPAASGTAELRVAKGAYVQAKGLTINTGSGRSTAVGVEVATDGSSLIHTTGLSTLGGALDVQSLGGFRPREGDRFTLIASSDPNGVYYSGNFSSFTSNIANGLPAGLTAFGGLVEGGDYQVAFQGYTAGDATGDHEVVEGDFSLLVGSWYAGGGKTWGQGDFSGDGWVDEGDFALLVGNWMWTLPPGSPPLPVPEPASVLLLSVGTSIALLRRRKH